MPQYLVCTFIEPQQIHVNTGIYGDSSNLISKYYVFNARYLINSRLQSDNDQVVEVELSQTFAGNKKVWNVTWHSDYISEDVFLVDSVDGVAPTSAMDLLLKIAALMR